MDSFSIKLPYLGTAKWGYIPKHQAMSILEAYYVAGGRDIDTATNYPINSDPKDLGLALSWIEEWCQTNNINDLRILLKLGAVDNTGSPISNLSPRNITEITDRYLASLGENLKTISIHWDNRGEEGEDLIKITNTLQTLKKYLSESRDLGLSGIKYPKIYYESEEFIGNWIIQVKENIFTSKDRRRYGASITGAKYIAYGINAKTMTSPQIKDSIYETFYASNIEFVEALNIRDFFDLSLLYANCNQSLDGFIIAPSNINQLKKTLSTMLSIDRASIDGKDKLKYFKHIKSIASNYK